MDNVYWMCLGILVGWVVSWFAKINSTQEEQKQKERQDFWNYN